MSGQKLMGSYLHIGIDDTDSTRLGCTTYIAALLVDKLSEIGVEFLDYPSLVRLNPNIPWKTRGNGALCLRLKTCQGVRDKVVDVVIETLEVEADLNYPGTQPGVVFYDGKEIPHRIREFASTTIHSVAEIDEALSLIQRFQCEAFGFNGGRGIIGALASIGEVLFGDHTYELIAYRSKDNRGSFRRVDEETVYRMNNETKGLTFDNIDDETRRILITPRGPDPVLLGIRGENPSVLKRAFGILEVLEAVERWMVFRTNQGTDAHLYRLESISDTMPNTAVTVSGSVIKPPKTITGGHVIFTIEDKSGCVDCAAYEPTGRFRKVVRKLIVGDLVEIHGGVRPPSNKIPKTINLEKLRIIRLAPKIAYVNPLCPLCDKSMESMGKEKGYRCKRCGRRERGAKKRAVTFERNLSEELYIPPPRAHRHLTKPVSRYGLEKSLEVYPLYPKDFWGVKQPSYQSPL